MPAAKRSERWEATWRENNFNVHAHGLAAESYHLAKCRWPCARHERIDKISGRGAAGLDARRRGAGGDIERRHLYNDMLSLSVSTRRAYRSLSM